LTSQDVGPIRDLSLVTKNWRTGISGIEVTSQLTSQDLDPIRDLSLVAKALAARYLDSGGVQLTNLTELMATQEKELLG
jgi:hypothetical protein